MVLKNTEVVLKLSFNGEKSSQNISALVKAAGRLVLVETEAVGRLALTVTVNSLAAVALVDSGKENSTGKEDNDAAEQ